MFGEIEVDLEKKPREITLDNEENQKVIPAKALISLGYPLVGEEMRFVADSSSKAKRFVSCVIGKICVNKP
ncbi:MAG: hypothetical protein L3J47_08090 [Sulfurovum sp.]|nr:hypothetical protein [Sulfurovum sp.]